MPVKIRLARHGRKARPFYHIVVADSRAPRDGKFIERLGSYNPNTNPATIDINFERALHWVMTGAQPSDTARAILSYEGVLYKKHLLGGVSKGAFDTATADTKFEAWKQTKAIQVQDKRNNLSKGKKETLAQRLAAEQEVNKARLAAISQKAEEAAKATEPQAEENSEATTEEASAE